jgi:hypothetical protein
VVGGGKKERANEQGGAAAAVAGEEKEKITTCFAPGSPKNTLSQVSHARPPTLQAKGLSQKLRCYHGLKSKSDVALGQ